MREKMIEIVVESIRELNEVWNNPALEQPDENTRLFSPGGNLDSLGLVALIAEIEERVSDQAGSEIVLADERAMSQKFSPFRSVRSLGTYVAGLVEDTR